MEFDLIVKLPVACLLEYMWQAFVLLASDTKVHLSTGVTSAVLKSSGW